MPSTTIDPPQKILLSVRDLSALLDLGERTVWRFVAMGRLPRPVTIGRMKKWRRPEIERWIQSGCPDRPTWESMSREDWS